MQQWYQCPKCGAPVSSGIKFCGNCGRQLNWTTQNQTLPISQYYCPRCGAPVYFGNQICQNCGIPLSWSNQKQTQSLSADRAPVTSSPSKSSTVKFLKWVGISILSLLLFLSLFVFGIAFLFNQTLLNPGFINSEVEKLELASLANEFIEQQSFEDFTEEIGAALSKTITLQEPQIKEGLNASIYSIYDYLLGKRDSPELPMLLRSTFLSTDFLVAFIDEVDIVPIVKPFLHQQVANWIPQGMEFLSGYLYSSLDQLLANQEPWLKDQLKTAADPIADYLVGESNSFNVTVSTEPVVDNFKEILFEDIMELPLPQLVGLSPDLFEVVFNESFNQFSQAIPSSIVIDETILGTGLQEQIRASLAELENDLTQMREYISYFQLGYVFLIVFILMLIAGIVLVYRKIRGATRVLGIIFLICGVFELAGLLIAKNFISERLELLTYDTPEQLQLWLQQLLNDFSVPLQMLSIGLAVAGIALIVISFIYKPHHEAEWT